MRSSRRVFEPELAPGHCHFDQRRRLDHPFSQKAKGNQIHCCIPVGVFGFEHSLGDTTEKPRLESCQYYFPRGEQVTIIHGRLVWHG
jgi:hypothetical protein